MRNLPNSLKAKEVFSVTNIEPLTINCTDWNSEFIWVYCCKLGETLTNFSFFIDFALKYCIKNIRWCFGDYIVKLIQDKLLIMWNLSHLVIHVFDCITEYIECWNYHAVLKCFEYQNYICIHYSSKALSVKPKPVQTSIANWHSLQHLHHVFQSGISMQYSRFRQFLCFDYM